MTIQNARSAIRKEFSLPDSENLAKIFDGISAVVEPAICLFFLALHYGSLGAIPKPNSDNYPLPKDCEILHGSYAKEKFNKTFPEFQSKRSQL